MMKQPTTIQPEVFDILLKLHAGVISPQDAMELLVPFLLECETPSQRTELEPIKEKIVAELRQRLLFDSHPFD